MIIPVYKPLGASTHQLAEQVGFRRSEPATHTGTLDPLAEGVVVVLTGQDRFLKGKLNWDKTYEFQILWGVRTDSLDMLGIVQRIHDLDLDTDLPRVLSATLPRFTGEYLQTIPAFSAKRHKGESFFDTARREGHVPHAQQLVTIHTLSLLRTAYNTIAQLAQSVQSKVQLVQGDFRQADVLSSWEIAWKTLAAQNRSELQVTSMRAHVSKRTYIRSLVHDLGHELGVPTTTLHILRTQEGPYTLDSCIKLSEVTSS